MKLKRPTVVVPADNPFQHDQLSRESSAAILTELVASLEEPLVLALEAPWGHGKTTFIRMWLQKLRNEGFVCLYFNAWEADHAQDPLIPFVGEMSAELPRPGKEGPEKRRIDEHIERLKQTGGQIAKRSLPVGVKLLTGGLLDLDEFSEKTLAETYEKLIEERFKEYESEKTTLKTFRDTLIRIIEDLKQSGSQPPLIIFVDELDRCRPPFAIALLERIKHLFDVAGIVFILALDKDQLNESVRGVYGAGCDAERYLRRFIDLDYSLPEPPPDKYARYLATVYGFDKGFPQLEQDPHADKQLVETFAVLSQVYGLRLRDQGQAFSLLAIAWRTLKRGEHINPIIAAFLIAMRVANRKSYDRFIANQLSVDNVLETIRQNSIGAAFLEKGYGVALEGFLSTYSEQEATIRERIERLQRPSQGADRLTPRAERLLAILGGGSRRREFDKLVSRLAIAEQFVKT